MSRSRMALDARSDRHPYIGIQCLTYGEFVCRLLDECSIPGDTDERGSDLNARRNRRLGRSGLLDRHFKRCSGQISFGVAF